MQISQQCKSFKNIEDVWNFQLSDVKVETNYKVFLPAAKGQPGTSVDIGEPKKSLTAATDTACFFVRDMKLTAADHRLFLSKDKIRGVKTAGPGRPKRPRPDEE